ncbi:hypothetical protein BVRB_3g050050 [Beta vulgaris subsp. vulgaris]|nr:hypothetical protein BVRB_3g050050 [Beta vulgaris subsp. vulgaris]
MDFQILKRRDLQLLCKRNNIPANTTNAAMADALASLPIVEGLEEYLRNPESDAHGSPDKSMITSSNVPRTTARKKALTDELEGSKLTTRTSCRTRTKAVEGTGKTPATRTTRKRASQEASIQKMMEKDLQAEFEADLEQQSEVSENNELSSGRELKEISEEVSGVSVEHDAPLLSECTSKVQQVSVGEEIIDMSEAQEEEEMLNGSKMVDFHSLGRKDLQILCKKNKIPANMTNAAMAAALESLETVEGLQELDSQAPSSPRVSGITSSCARRSRTTMKITKEEPQSSRLITKSCRGSRRRVVDETPAAPNTREKAPHVGSALTESITKEEDSAVHRSELKKMNLCMDDVECPVSFSNGESELGGLENSGLSGVAKCSSDISDSLIQEAPVSESTLEDDSGKGNSGHLEAEKMKEPQELVSKADENVVEEVVLEISEVTEALTNLVKVDIVPEAVDYFATQQEDLTFCSGDGESESTQAVAASESDDCELENVVAAPSVQAADLCLHEKLEEQTFAEFVSESISEADANMGNSKHEKAVTFTSDLVAEIISPIEHEANQAEDEMFQKSDTELSAQADNVSLESNDVESEADSEGSDTEDEMLQESDTDSTDKFSLKTNVDSESEGSNTEDEMSESASEDNISSLEVNVDSEVEDPIFFTEFDTESTIQFKTETPLGQKSVRQLKRMLKDRLQATTLAKSMEKLTLEETEISLPKVEEDLQGLVESECDNADIAVPQVISKDIEDEINDDETEVQNDTSNETLVTNSVNTATLYSVEILQDNEVIPEDEVAGNINVATFPPPLTPSKVSSKTNKKPLLFTTPSKTPTKTPTTAGRKNCILDVNKENIDNSVSKIKLAVTGSGKVISAVSMGKLKKEFKVLQQQQSEKKSQALQPRSENNCLLTSP